jgi:hypothetical protein
MQMLKTIHSPQTQVLKNFWYGIEHSASISSKPKSLTFMGHDLVLFLVHLPVSDRQTITKWLHIRNFILTPLADSFMHRDVVKTFVQDNQAVRIQAGAAPEDLTAEIHAPSDALELAYRKFYNQAVQMGWADQMEVEIK